MIKTTKRDFTKLAKSILVIMRDVKAREPENELHEQLSFMYNELHDHYEAAKDFSNMTRESYLGCISFRPVSYKNIISQIYAQEWQHDRCPAYMDNNLDFLYYNMLESCIKNLHNYAKEKNLEVVFEPGFGISTGSNGNKDKIDEMIEKYFADSDVIAYVYKQ